MRRSKQIAVAASTDEAHTLAERLLEAERVAQKWHAEYERAKETATLWHNEYEGAKRVVDDLARALPADRPVTDLATDRAAQIAGSPDQATASGPRSR